MNTNIENADLSGLASGEEESRTRSALLHMLEELQRDRDVIRRAHRNWVDTFDSVRDPMMVHDAEHRVVRCNRAYAALAGTDVREIVGKPYWQMFPKRDGPLPGCRHVAAGPESTVEEEFRLLSGEVYLSKSFPVSDLEGTTPHFLHVMQDITERNRIRDAVERSERRYRALAENSSDLVVVLDAQGAIAYVSPSVRQIVGYEAAEVLGRRYFDFVHPDDLATARTRFPEIVATPGPVAQMEFRYLHKNGSWVTLESIARNALGDPLVGGIVVNARDVTQRNVATRNIANLSRLYATLSGVNSAIVHSRNAGELFDEICRVAVERGQFRIAWIARYDRATETLRLVAQRGAPESEFAQIKGIVSDVADSAGTSSTRIGEEAVVHVSDLAADPQPTAWDALAIKLGARGCATVPIRCEGQAIGALKLFADQPDFFDSRELDLLREMGQDIEFALDGFEREAQRATAQHNLRDSEARLHAMFDQAGVGIIQTSLAGTFLEVNPAFCAMLGYSDTELVGRGFQDITHPDDQAKSAALAASIAGPGAAAVSGMLEKRYVRKDGSTVWANVTVSTVRDAEGNPGYFVVIVQDISKRKQVQAKLRESHALLETTERIAGIGGFRWNVGSDAVAWSNEIYRMFGRDPQHWQPTLTAFVAAIHHEDRQRVQDAIAAAVAGTSPFDTEFRIVRPDGSERFIHSQAELVRDAAGKPLRMIGTSHDITERRLAEDTLRKSEERFRGYFDLGLIGMAITLPDKRVSEVNDKICEILGYEREQLLQMDWASITHPDDLPADVARFERMLAGEVDNYSLDKRFIRKDGVPVDTTISVAAVRKADRSVDYVVALLQDITERKRAEESLRGALVATIEAIAATVETRDPYTAGHQRRVASLAAAIGQEMGLPADTVEGIHFGALIHDLGKVQVPAELLSKPTRLTKPEYDLIKTHPQAGYNIVKDIKFPWPVADMVHQHHERLDGSGYPQGLKGDAIALEARILAVADVFEAMSSHRPYRASLGFEPALKEIQDKRGTWYEPAAVDACLRLFREKNFVLARS